MQEQGYYGTEDNPIADLYSERRVMTPQTSGGSLEEGEYRLRTDLNSGDRIATYELNVGNGVEEAPIYPVSESVTAGVVKVRHVYVPNEGWGFVPLADNHPTYPEFAFWHDSTRYGWHDSNFGIPESEADNKLIHRWILNDINGTVEDVVGNDNGTVNGINSTSGAWAGGRAGDGGGDYISTGTWGSFGSNLTSDWAAAFSFNTSFSDFSDFIGIFLDSGLQLRLRVATRTQEGQVEMHLADTDGDILSTHTDGAFNDQSTYRCVMNKTANNAGSIEVYMNQSAVSVTARLDEAFDNVSNFDIPVGLFARSTPSGFDNHLDTILDDVCVYSSSLTQAEAESYTNPWS